MVVDECDIPKSWRNLEEGKYPPIQLLGLYNSTSRAPNQRPSQRLEERNRGRLVRPSVDFIHRSEMVPRQKANFNVKFRAVFAKKLAHSLTMRSIQTVGDPEGHLFRRQRHRAYLLYRASTQSPTPGTTNTDAARALGDKDGVVLVSWWRS